MRFLFRVDGSRAIGLGHVRRCLSLAHALRRQGAEIRFIVRDLGLNVNDLISREGFDCSVLPAPRHRGLVTSDVPHGNWAGVPWEVDVEETVSVSARQRLDWVVVDHYSFDAKWHREVANGLHTRIAVIDDLGDRKLSPDVLLDHNYSPDHRAKYRSRVSDSVPILGGPQYALLDRAYAAAARYVPNETVRSIGVFMGGIDATNCSSLALRACRDQVRFQGPVEVVTTRDNPHLNELTASTEQDRNTKILLDLPNLAGFFARHDIQIGAGGGAAMERICIGAPTVALVCAENQLLSVPMLAQLGALITIDNPTQWRSLTRDDVGKAVRRLVEDAPLRKRLSETSRAMVDGKGAERVADLLLKSNAQVSSAV